MKYRLVNENFKDKYAENYIKSKGIEDIEKYIHPDTMCINSPSNFDNIEAGANLLFDTIKNNKNIKFRLFNFL